MRKLNVIECLEELARIDCKQMRISCGEDEEYNKLIKNKTDELLNAFYKNFDENAFLEEIKKAIGG